MGHGGPQDEAEEAGDTTQVGPRAALRVERPAAAEEPERLGGRYETLSLIGSGGGGVVFRARDLVTGGLVAVKTAPHADGHVMALFEREARVLSRLRHPAIVKYLDHGFTRAGAPFLVMELLAGETLRERIDAGALEPGPACQLLARLLDALASAHANGVIHRDVKPSNVFLPAGDLQQAKLLDFGVAREAQGWMRTLTGQVMGTPLYMAPEQALGRKDVDARADIFAAGCVLVECLTGRPLFVGAGSGGLAKLALADHFVPTSGLERLPAPLVTLVLRMLHKDPAGRPQDAAALAEELRLVSEALGSGASELPPAPAALGAREARPVMVLMVGPADVKADLAQESRRLDEVVTRWGGDVQVLVSGASLVTFGVGGARELAVRAARAALELRTLVVGRPMALALGRATVEGRALVGAAIDETTRLVSLSPAAAAASMTSAAVFLDADTAELLSETFDLQVHETAAGAAYQLLGERASSAASRLVLGKPVPFVGRDRELRGLEGLVRECFDEPRLGAALVLAPAGGGKSRLRRELLSRLREDNDRLFVLVGAADAYRAAAPYGLLSAALRQSAHAHANDPPAAGSHKLEALLRRTAPTLLEPDLARVVAFLGEMAGLDAPPHLLPLLLSARQDPRTMADQVRVAWLDWLAAALREGPLLLVLEDLHWGDSPSVQLIDLAMKAHRDAPLVVLGFARPEVNARFPNLWRDAADRVSLPPLRTKAARDLVKAVLPQLASSRVDALIERADGNPFFLEELVRVEASRDAETAQSTPPTVLAAVQARLDLLGEGAKRVLRAAAIFGETFWPEGVSALLPTEVRTETDDWLEVLANAELVLSPPPSGGVGERASGERPWRFRHALVRDAAYDTLTDGDRKIGHKLAATHLQEMGERDGVVLASHFERAGDAASALLQWRLAAEQALEASDFQAALDRCARADALGPQGEDLGRLRLVECHANNYKGDWAAAEAAARSAVATLTGAERWTALAEHTVNLCNLQRYDEMRVAQGALYADRQAGHRLPAWAYALMRASWGFNRLGESQMVEGVLEEVRDVALSGDLRLKAMWNGLKGEVEQQQGRPAAALPYIQRGVRLLEEVGDLRELCNLQNNEVLALTDLGRIDEAERRGADLLALATRIGHACVPVALANLACLALSRRQPAEAEAYADRLLATEVAALDARLRGFGFLLKAQAALEISNGRKALAWAEQAATALSQSPSLLPAAEAALARALLLVGRTKEAKIYAESAVTSLRKLSGVEHGEFLIWLAAVEGFRADGALAEARSAALDARAALEARLAPFEAADERDRVLGALPELPALEVQARALEVKFPLRRQPQLPKAPLAAGLSPKVGSS